MIHRCVILCLTIATAGCIDARVTDDPVRGAGVLPAGTVLPAIETDPILAAQLEEYDGVSGTVPRVTSFAGGTVIHTWDFGPAPSFAAPVYMLVRATGPGTFDRVAHNTIVETIPGDPGYSPYWGMYLVYVTARYQGEVLSSVAAIDEAVSLGLVDPPVAQDFAVNCAETAPTISIEVGGGQPPLPPPARFNVKGWSVPYYDFGKLPLLDRVTIPEARRYQLRREGGEPLSEPVRGIDMTADGDVNDSNDVYDLGPTDPMPTALCRTVTVAVAATTASIDTSQDETMAALNSATQLFTAAGPRPAVLAYAITDDLHNCIRQRAAGGF
jgi:hypothetical protein